MKKNRINRNKAKEFFPLSSLPKVNGARISSETNLGILPVIDLGKDCFSMENGWELIGWTTPPYKGSAPDAIVVSRFEKAERWGDMFAHAELGVWYWTHGNAQKMKFEI